MEAEDHFTGCHWRDAMEGLCGRRWRVGAGGVWEASVAWRMSFTVWCWTVRREAASLEGDRRETGPLCCCHGHYASLLGFSAAVQDLLAMFVSFNTVKHWF